VNGKGSTFLHTQVKSGDVLDEMRPNIPLPARRTISAPRSHVSEYSRPALRNRLGDDYDAPGRLRGMSRALLKILSGRCHVYATSSSCFVKHLFV